MKKRITVVLVVFATVLVVLIIAISSFIGSQVFMGSTQLVTNEKTKGLSEAFLQQYGMSYKEFSGTYVIESMNIPSA